MVIDKKIELVLLNLDKPVLDCLGYNKTIGYFLYSMEHINQDVVNTLVEYKNSTFQHFYLLSPTDKINEGDWYISKNSGTPIHCTMTDFLNHDDKKIILTTDEMLNDFNCISCGNVGCHLCANINVPKPTEPFLQIIINEFNKGNSLDKFLIEYEEKTEIEVYYKSPFGDCVKEVGTGVFIPKLNPDKTINIKPFTETWEDVFSELQANYENDLYIDLEMLNLLKANFEVPKRLENETQD